MISTDIRASALSLANRRFVGRAARSPRSFLSLDNATATETASLIARGLEMKHAPYDFRDVLRDRLMVLLFQKTSTRTRCSFERAARELGAGCWYMDWNLSNFVLADLADEARVLSRYCDVIVSRVMRHKTLEIMAANSEAPVINALCDRYHPCQAVADYLTMAEYFGQDLSGLKLAYIGDGNNVCRSLAHGALQLGVTMAISGPRGYRLDAETLAAGKGKVAYAPTPQDAVRDADVIYTDTWISMGSEDETNERLRAFDGYCVDAALMAVAPASALVMHCLPAHVGWEIGADVLRGPRSLVVDQAENRTHAQKALLEWLLVQ